MSGNARTARPRRLRRPKAVTSERWVAWQVIRRTFDEDAFSDRAFQTEAERAELDPRARSAAQHLAYGTVRRAKTIDHVIGVVGKRPLRKIDPPVLHALRLGVFQLLFSDGSADHAAVDQSVEIVRGVSGERAVAFTNAVLRRAQVDGHTILGRLDPDDPADEATRLSLPDWIVARMHAAYGNEGVRALAVQDESPGTSAFRCNTLRAPVDQMEARARELGVELAPVPEPFHELVPEAVLVSGPTAAIGPMVDEGWVVPQSVVSSLVARMLAPRAGERVLDMCAAPGGKTLHVAALMGNEGEVLACELHDHRADMVRSRATLAGATCVTVMTGDATALDVGTVGVCDRVLVDAPCTGLGVLGRRPDARWHRAEDDLDGLVDLQRRLLETAAKLVRPGGVVVYSTCTMLPDENEQVVDWALANTALEPGFGEHGNDAHVFPPDLQAGGAHAAHALRTWPHLHGTDGFFLARLHKPG